MPSAALFTVLTSKPAIPARGDVVETEGKVSRVKAALEKGIWGRNDGQHKHW